MDDLPRFRYHPDPLTTRSARRSPEACQLCGVARGVVYDGPIYGREVDALCLACIASGAASEALSEAGSPAEFTDVGWGKPDGVPPSVLEEVRRRTPGFHGWQDEHWLYHCQDAAAFLGPAGYRELAAAPDALDMVLHENDHLGWTEEESEAHARTLRVDGDATAYLFCCLHCGRHLAYTDVN